MRFAVSEMRFSPSLPTPVTYPDWIQITQSLDDCLAARNIQWQYSLVSIQGDRSICVYQVPYADAAREAYREAGMPFQRIWSIREMAVIPDASSNDSVVVLDVDAELFQQTNGSLKTSNFIPHPFVILTNDQRAIAVFAETAMDSIQTVLNMSKLEIPLHSLWQAVLIQPST